MQQTGRNNRMPELGDQSVCLSSYRGTGQSTLARELANRLHYDWADADDIIEQRAGKSIAAIFADAGEPAFRDLEAQVVEELAIRNRVVAALGGGAVLRQSNRAAI